MQGRGGTSRLDRGRRQLVTTGRVVRGVVRSPALRRVALAFLLFRAVETGSWVAGLLYAYDRLGRNAVGLAALIQLLPAAVFAPLAAGLGDRMSRGRLLLAGYALYAASDALAGLGMVAYTPVPIVFALLVVAGSVLTIVRPTQGALIPGLARTPEELTAANGLTGAVEGLGQLVGPLAAAAILAFAGPGEVFLISAAALALGAVLVFRLPTPARFDWLTGGEELPETPARATASDPGHEPPGSSATHGPVAVVHQHASILDGLRLLARERSPRLVVILLGLRSVTVGAFDVLSVLLALEVYGMGESGAGTLSAAMGLGAVLGGGVAFSLVGRPQLGPALALSALGWAAAIGLVALGAPPVLAPVLIAAGGLSHAVYDVAGRTILQRVTPHRVLAGVLGGLEGMTMATMAIGSLLVPAVAAMAGVQWAAAVAGVVLPAGVIAAWVALRSIDRSVEVPVRALRLLRRNPIFAPLPPPLLEDVGRRVRWVTAEPGEAVIREGDHGDRYYVIESGTFRVTKAARELRVMEGPGPGFGEIALLRDVPRTATVTAVTEGVLLALDRVDFLEAMTGDEAARLEGERLADQHAAGVASA